MEMSAKDMALAAVLILGGGFLLVLIPARILAFFVALRAKPTPRAAASVGIAYVLATAVLVFSLPLEYAYYVPLGLLPGALIVFTWFRWDLRRRWIDDEIAESGETALEDGDWISGLLRLALAIGLGVGIVLLRWARHAVF
jgi:hypothetical protein